MTATRTRLKHYFFLYTNRFLSKNAGPQKRLGLQPLRRKATVQQNGGTVPLSPPCSAESLSERPTPRSACSPGPNATCPGGVLGLVGARGTTAARETPPPSWARTTGRRILTKWGQIRGRAPPRQVACRLRRRSSYFSWGWSLEAFWSSSPWALRI